MTIKLVKNPPLLTPCVNTLALKIYFCCFLIYSCPHGHFLLEQFKLYITGRSLLFVLCPKETVIYPFPGRDLQARDHLLRIWHTAQSNKRQRPTIRSSRLPELQHKIRVEHTTSSPQYYQANGKVECFVATVKNTLQKCKETNEDPALALLAVRNMPIASQSPAFASTDCVPTYSGRQTFI